MGSGDFSYEGQTSNPAVVLETFKGLDQNEVVKNLLAGPKSVLMIEDSKIYASVYGRAVSFQFPDKSSLVVTPSEQGGFSMISFSGNVINDGETSNVGYMINSRTICCTANEVKVEDPGFIGSVEAEIAKRFSDLQSARIL